MQNNTIALLVLSFIIGMLFNRVITKQEIKTQNSLLNLELEEIQVQKEALRNELIIVISNDEKEIEYLNTLSVDSLILYCESAGRIPD